MSFSTKLSSNFSTFLYTILEFAGHSGIIISLAAVGIAYTTSIFYGVVHPNFPLLCAVFFMVFSVYRINKITDFEEDRINYPERVRFIHGDKTSPKWRLFVFPALTYIIALGITFSRNINSFLVVVISLIMILLYGVTFPSVVSNFFKIKKMKAIPIFKSLFSSLGWGLIVFLTAFFLNQSINNIAYSMFFLVLVRFTINTVAFDFKDTVGDHVNRIYTLPVVFGGKKIQKLLFALNVFAAIFVFFAISQKWLPEAAYILNLTTLYAHFFISKLDSKTIDLKWFSDVVIDSEFIVWPFLALIGYLIFR
ncbi:UbiA family prenyltransferase [Candidatus Micrarchaeota archaeon]|nr:UbiA family prenyltransferase [Candidatus Micrarchaeota archaeon]